MRRERGSAGGEVDAETETDAAGGEFASSLDFVQADAKMVRTRRLTTARYIP